LKVDKSLKNPGFRATGELWHFSQRLKLAIYFKLCNDGTALMITDQTIVDVVIEELGKRLQTSGVQRVGRTGRRLRASNARGASKE